MSIGFVPPAAALRLPAPPPVVAGLFAPLRLGALDLPHRVVMAPMTRRRASRTGMPTPLMAQYYAQRAGAGLLITEAAWIQPEGAGPPHTPGLYADAQEAAWEAVTRAVHGAGGRIALQLWHAGRLSHPRLTAHGSHPVAPSAVVARGLIETPDGTRPYPTPRVLAEEEMPALISAYVRAALRARAAGFDAIEIHAAEGCLLDQFLRDATNRRAGRYGGSLANRARLLLEIVEGIAVAIGPQRVGVRLSPLCTRNDMADTDPQGTFLHVARLLSGSGLAWLHLVEPSPPAMAGAPRRLTRAMRDAFGGAVILAGGHEEATAAAAIGASDADAVAFGRAFIANPDLPDRLRQGAPLAEPDPATILGGGAAGYTDYPALPQQAAPFLHHLGA